MAGRLTSVSVKVGAGHNLYTPEEFAKLPVSQRIELVMQNKVIFLDEDGAPIPPLEAIDQLPKPAAPARTARPTAPPPKKR